MIFLAFTRDGDRMRRRIGEHVMAEPGITKSELARRLSVAWYTIEHHVNRLERKGVLHVEKGDWSHQLFPADTPEAQRPWLRALHDQDKSRVLEALLLGGEVGVYELSDQLGFSRKVVRSHLSGFIDEGIVEKRGNARPRYRLTSPPLDLGEHLMGMHAGEFDP